MTSLEENKRIVRQYPEEVATKRNLDLIDELETEDFVEHGPFGQETHGPEADREWMQEFLAAFPDFEATVEDIVAEGDTVAMRVTLRGTHEGTFMDIEPTGQSFEIQNMVFTRLRDGKIAERWVQPDTLGLLQQLGVIEPPTG
ncbi:ester cyclase [Haloarchaeobius sp. HRN-SO-5]|uniref:ester cyclase n=1 Tax=Haloarchaeobius sp. HRN-SO-5 TaxID=3446118 RepID=UPI003EBE3580